ncbi:MAG: 50S ribosomal protein L16 [Candidatus Diapherotrites archaeon]|nr:50S ribosomal protein L16 [Candidatus Diapherotrites archaeon]
MVHIRPARCYRKVKKRAYCRTAKRVARKSYIKGVPGTKVARYDMGVANIKYKYRVDLIADETKLIRHNALEAMRVSVVREMTPLGTENHHFQLRAVPHHVMRENAMISGAGADRMQTGMKHSFGRPIGKAARVNIKKIIASISVESDKGKEMARKAFKKATHKLPLKTHVEVKELR